MMTQAGSKSIDMAALIGSRICHDLISPIGAIGNGVELMAMSGLPEGPEVRLIRESVENANARVRFFRIAYGAAADGQSSAGAEIIQILGALTRAGRIRYDWQVTGSIPRGETKLALLSLQCLESAMPVGGTITTTRSAEGAWEITAEGPRFKDIDGLWKTFASPEEPDNLPPSEIQFALAPLQAFDLNRPLTMEPGPGRLTIRF